MSDSKLFLDIFRRADKNDDERISLDEFNNYFSDGILTNTELETIFRKIDVKNTNNLDHGELCTYFKQHVGAFDPLFQAVEQLNTAIQHVTQITSETYCKGSEEQKFLTRFFARESLDQLGAVQRALESTVDGLDEAAMKERSEGVVSVESPVGASMTAFTQTVAVPPVPGRVGRRARRLDAQFSTPDTPVAGSETFEIQLQRLTTLVNQLEKKVTFGGIQDEELDVRDENFVLVVERNMSVLDEQRTDFRSSIQQYVNDVERNNGNILISVRVYKESSRVHVYEIWENEETWKRHQSTSAAKSLRRNLIEHLDLPEATMQLRMPRAWFESYI